MKSSSYNSFSIQRRHWVLLFWIVPLLLTILALALVLFFIPAGGGIMMEKIEVMWNLVIVLLIGLPGTILCIYYWRKPAVPPTDSSIRLYPEGVSEMDYNFIERLFRDVCHARLYPLTGGFSGTLVFRVDYRDQQGERLPKVLKLGPREEIKREEENYIDFVEDSILGVRMSKCEYEEGRGAMLYTYANMSLGETITFEEFYLDEESTIDDVVKVIKETFLNTLHLWLSGAQTNRESYLYQTYNLAYARRIHQGIEDLGFDPDTSYFDCLGRRFPNPLKEALKWFETRVDRPMYTKDAIIHGDLNSRNILIDGNQNVFVIDFAKTRRDHFLRDFCKLEAEILFCLTQISCTDDMEYVIVLAQELLLDENGEPFRYLRDLLEVNVADNIPPRLERARYSIKTLREIASQAIGAPRIELEAEQYYLGLLHYTLNTLRYKQCDQNSKLYALIFASLLCRALS